MSILRAWHIHPQLDQTWNTAQPSKKQKSEIEKVQRRAAKYTTGRFHNTSSVTSMLDHLEWNSLDAETLPKSLCYAKLHTIWLPSIQTSISHLRLHSHDTAIVFDTNPSPHPLTTSNSVSSLIQLSFGMLYHLVLSLLLLWISLNHRSKPTTSKQFSILYICKYVTFSFLFFVTLLFCLLINCKYMVC